MSLKQLHSNLKESKIKVLFTDYFDTLVHRTVHPNYTQRLWSKNMIRELGLKMSIDELYFIRQESVSYLTTKLCRADVEIPYNALKAEVLKRLINEQEIDISKSERFLRYFEIADLKTETSVQTINPRTLEIITSFKASGGKVYLVSDFYGSLSLFKGMLSHHGILNYFDGVYSSAELEKSKHNGSIYKPILEQLHLDPSVVMMMGDNQRSDITNAKQNGLNAYLLPHQRQLRKNKLNNFGNDAKAFKRVIKSINKRCHKKDAEPFSEYIVFYHFFVERLYYECRQNNIKSLFFLSREGLYLKALFDSYQEHTLLNTEDKIATKYLRISRQASLQIALKPIENETFSYLRKNYNALSAKEFLTLFSFSEDKVNEILSEVSYNTENKIDPFFDSVQYQELLNTSAFKKYYEQHRNREQNAFVKYIDSLGVDVKNEGIYLVDIGWGGTMQESIHKFFNDTIEVTGFYVGLKEIYNITNRTKRYGLLFSILPYKSYTDHILLANGQLYEQFLAAGHGSALGYDENAPNFTREYHEPNEKWLYEHYIEKHQEFTYKIHKSLLAKLENVCYEHFMVQNEITNLALKIGLLQSSRKLKYLETLSKGFYQNIGDNQVGISYTPPKIKNIKKTILKFLINPEHYFRYLVKLKPALRKKSALLAFFTPMYPIYLYFKFNKYLRYRWLGKILLLKYNVLK